MGLSDYLSDDGRTVLALCSNFGLTDGPPGEFEPFKLSEWNQLARQIQSSPLKRPAALHGRDAAGLARELTIQTDDAERIVRLLERTDKLAHDLDCLFEKGIWAVTRVDEGYPRRLLDTLKQQAPTVLFGAGRSDLLQRPGVAVVGSRNIDESGAAFAKAVGRKAVEAGLSVVSGGARGTDRIAMDGAIEADGIALGVLADSLEATIRKSDVYQFLQEEKLVLLTPYSPTAGFTVGGAMGRNKVIYGLAEFAVIVSSDYQTGGTWGGAVEALKAGWCPLFVRQATAAGKGNAELVKLGGTAFPETELSELKNLREWMMQHVARRLVERDLFS